MRDFLLRNMVFPSNVLERNDGRGKIIGTLDVVAPVSLLVHGREYRLRRSAISGKSSSKDNVSWRLGSEAGKVSPCEYDGKSLGSMVASPTPLKSGRENRASYICTHLAPPSMSPTTQSVEMGMRK